MMTEKTEQLLAETSEVRGLEERAGRATAKAAQILRNAQPEIDRIQRLRVEENRLLLQDADERHAAAKADKQKWLSIVRQACKSVSEYGGEIGLMYHASEIRPVVEYRGLRVRMEGGMAVIYKGV